MTEQPDILGRGGGQQEAAVSDFRAICPQAQQILRPIPLDSSVEMLPFGELTEMVIFKGTRGAHGIHHCSCAFTSKYVLFH